MVESVNGHENGLDTSIKPLMSELQNPFTGFDRAQKRNFIIMLILVALALKISDQKQNNERADQSLTVTSKVPSAAETMISYVCTPDRLEAVLGDLERNFARRAARHGDKAARRWYWWQTFRTVTVFGVQMVVKLVLLRELLRKLGL